MIRIGVISDTHGWLDERAYAALADCNHIIHAGDICDPRILRELQTLAPVTAVLGNNDYNEYGATVRRYARPVIGGVKFLVAHYPHDANISSPMCRAISSGDTIPDVCIHGHTHVPRLDYGKDVRPAQYVLNPGSASYPRGGWDPSIAKIDVEDSQVKRIVVESLKGSVLLSVG